MAELNTIVDVLRRHRRDLDESVSNATTRSGETAELIRKIESLRERSEKTQRSGASAGQNDK